MSAGNVQTSASGDNGQAQAQSSQSILASTPSETEGARYNIFRDSALRYMGYANEIGESFRYQFPRFVVPSYILSFGYCGADALTTGYRVWKDEEKESSSNGNELSREYRAGVATLDTLLWQSLASVMIPGFTINMIVKASRFAVARTTALPAMAVKWLPTACGIGSIPIIIHPIDSLVDFSLDNSTRVWLSENSVDGDNGDGK